MAVVQSQIVSVGVVVLVKLHHGAARHQGLVPFDSPNPTQSVRWFERSLISTQLAGEQTFGDNYARQSQSARRAGVSAGIWPAAMAQNTQFMGIP